MSARCVTCVRNARVGTLTIQQVLPFDPSTTLVCRPSSHQNEGELAMRTSGVKNLLLMFEIVMRNVGTLLDSFGRSEVSTFSYGRQVRVACLTCRSDVRNARARGEEVTRDKKERKGS